MAPIWIGAVIGGAELCSLKWRSPKCARRIQRIPLNRPISSNLHYCIVLRATQNAMVIFNKMPLQSVRRPKQNRDLPWAYAYLGGLRLQIYTSNMYAWDPNNRHLLNPNSAGKLDQIHAKLPKSKPCSNFSGFVPGAHTASLQTIGHWTS